MILAKFVVRLYKLIHISYILLWWRKTARKTMRTGLTPRRKWGKIPRTMTIGITKRMDRTARAKRTGPASRRRMAQNRSDIKEEDGPDTKEKDDRHDH